MLKRYLLLWTYVSLSTSLVSCSSDFKSADLFVDSEFAEGESVTGFDIFTRRLRGANTFTCNTCHTVNSVTASFRTPGHDITNAAFRTSYKNGEITELRDAVNSCIEHWMAGEPISSTDILWRRLSSWLEEMIPSNIDNLVYNIIQPPTDLSGGDVVRGMSVFNQTCAGCHGIDAVGTTKGPSLAGSSLSEETIARRVRTSGPINNGEIYDGLTGGRMPFWAEDKLSDDELRDIIAFIGETVVIQPPSQNKLDISLPGVPSAGTCSSNHPSVGSIAQLSRFSHQVGGTIRVVDDCTLEVSNFTFDGGGIDIRFYTGVDGNFFSGSIVSQNLLGTFYSGQTVTFRLPSNISLDNFNSLSVWCVPVGIDFGSASW